MEMKQMIRLAARLSFFLWAFVAWAHPASAQVFRAYAPRQSYELRGDILLTGNRNLEPTRAAAVGNNNEATGYIDIDNDATTFNSSSAILKLPAGVPASDIVYARLYWVGRIQPAPTNPSVKLSVTGSASGYQTYQSPGQTVVKDVFKSGNDIDVYIASTDVTAQAKTAIGAQPNILVGDIAATNSVANDALSSQGALAGWSLIVVYKQSSSLIRQLRIFDGASKVNNGNNVSASITGFRTPDQSLYDVRFGAVAFEGDFNITGDRFKLNGTDLSNSVNAADNFFNSSVSQADALFTASEMNPALRNGNNTLGTDVDRLTLTGQGAANTFFPNATTTANLQFTSTGDEYYPTAFTTSIPSFEVSGRVFEDVNYGGGAGRDPLNTTGVAPVTGARVELYNATTGAFVAATNTDNTGTYYFYQLGPGKFRARVVNSTVASTRPGNTAGLLPVQTFRTNATGTAGVSATATPVTNRVGGENPALVDALANTTNANYSTLGTATNVVQSPTDIELGDEPVVGVNFAYNFDTIVNTKDAGQGSLRQFVLNSNALSNAGLDQVANAQFDPAAGVETSIFQIPASALTGGIGKITLASALAITGANAGATSIDGRTQTASIGDTNAGNFGTGGRVGVGNIALPTLPKPEIEINGPNSVKIGLNIAAGGAIVRNVSMWGFGTTGDSDTDATIRVSSPPSAPIIAQVLLGASATSGDNVPISPANYGKGDLIRASGVTGGNVTNSLLAFGGGRGITLGANANNWTIQNNEIRDNARDANGLDGIDAEVAGTQILENLVYNHGGSGIDSFGSTGGATIRNNTSRNNGLLNTPTAGESAGIRLYGTGNSVTLNISSNNYGAGIQVQSGGQSLISRNSIFGNGDLASNATATPSGQIGIDLLRSTDDVARGTSPFVTPNASGAKGTGGNGLLNFPVVTSASVQNGQLTLEGFAPAGANVEVFLAAPDPSGFGEGQTFVFNFVEGSGADADNTTGSYNAASLQAAGYSPAVAALAGSETNAQRFRFVGAPGVISNSSSLTATATVANQTSEFSPVLRVNNATVRGTVYLDANRNGTLDSAETGANIGGLFVKAVLNGQAAAAQAVAVDTTTGAFSFSGLGPGTYTLVLDDNNALADTTPAFPAGFVGTQSPGGTRVVTLGNQPVQSQNFGLFNGAQISGNVYEDGGAGTGPGIAGVKINLIRTDSGAIIDSATTDGSGNFAFSLPNNLAPGTLRVVEINPAGYNSVSGNAGNTGGAYALATDAIQFDYVAGSTYSGLKFGDSRGVTFTGEDAKTGPVGSSVVYSHVFTAQSAGSVTFNTTQRPSPANPDWSVVAYRDGNGNGVLDGADPLLTNSTAVPVVAGTPITVFLKNFIPQTAANGAQDRLTIAANFAPTGNNSGPTQTISRSDLTTVSTNSSLVLVKTVDKATAKSKDTLVYTVQYRNTGTEALTNLVIRDATPAYTTFLSATNGTLAPGLSAPTIAAPAIGGKGNVTWTFGGSLNPGQSGTVTFRVKVQ